MGVVRTAVILIILFINKSCNVYVAIFERFLILKLQLPMVVAKVEITRICYHVSLMCNVQSDDINARYMFRGIIHALLSIPTLEKRVDQKYEQNKTVP